MFEGSVVIIKYKRDWAHWRHLHRGWLQCSAIIHLLVWRSLLQNPHCGISSHFIVTTSLEKWQGWSTETYTCRICLRSIWTKCNRFCKPNTIPRLCFGVLRGNWLNLFFFFSKPVCSGGENVVVPWCPWRKSINTQRLLCTCANLLYWIIVKTMVWRWPCFYK